MAAHVQEVGRNKNDIGTLATTLAVAVPAGGVPVGHFLHLIFATAANIDIVTGASDSRGNTYTERLYHDHSGTSHGLYVFTCKVTTALQAADAITVSFSSSSAHRAMVVNQFSGSFPTSNYDTGAIAEGSSAAPSSGNVTTAQATELLVGAGMAGSGAGDWTAGSPFVELSEYTFGTRAVQVEWREAGVAGSYAATATFPIAGNWVQSVVAIKQDSNLVVVGRTFEAPWTLSTTFVTDSFTNSDGVQLQTHVGEFGADWTRHPSFSTNVDIRSNRIRVVASAGTALYTTSGVPNSAAYEIEAVVVQRTAEGKTSFGGRCSTTVDTGYYVRRDASAQTWELIKVVAGTVTPLGSWPENLANGNSRTVRLVVTDAAKTVFVEGVQRITSADNAITAAGFVGVRFIAPGGLASGVHIDQVGAANTAPVSSVGRDFAAPYVVAGLVGRAFDATWLVAWGAIELVQRVGRKAKRGVQQPPFRPAAPITVGQAGQVFALPSQISGVVGRTVPLPYSVAPSLITNAVYIDQLAGDDSRSLVQAQSPATPWTSFTKAYATVPDEPGWIVYVRGGAWVNKAKFLNRNTRQNMLTYRAMPGETVVLERVPGITTTQMDLRAVYVSNSHQLRFEGFDITGGGAIVSTSGGTPEWIEFVGNSFSAYEMTLNNAIDVLFDLNTFHDYVGSGRKGIYTSGSNAGAVRLTIKRNIFERIQHDACALYYGLTDLLVEDNIFRQVQHPPGSGIHSDCIQIAPLTASTSGFVIVRRNIMTDVAQAILVKDGVTRGLVLDSNVCGVTDSSTTWSCMIFHAPSAVVVNNTFSKAFYVRLSQSTNVVVANNIMPTFHKGQASDGGVMPTFAVDDYNLVGATSGYRYLIDPSGPNEIVGSPTYTDAANGDYELTAGSAGRNNGAVAHMTATDQRGRARPFGAGPDRGGLERQS